MSMFLNSIDIEATKIPFGKVLVFIVLFMLLINNTMQSQTMLVAKFSPIGIHPFKEKNSHLFENKLDENGVFVTEPCFIIGAETLLYDDVFSLRYLVGGLSDAASCPAAFLHLGLKYKFVQFWRNSFSIGAGVSFYGRKLWSSIDNYVDESFWAENGKWEYSLGPMAEIEYALLLGERHDITASLLYGHQNRTFTITLGYRFWLSTMIKHPKSCGSCPFSGKKNKKKTKWHF
ncbi:hypothetical protein LJC11_00340 [Bacteroidales bacterium OttesenSCG-928-I21]|nr:hypothetical protein [Bacteroidales bacterium OttesenSCG-928-I21]